MPKNSDVLERFWERVDKTGDCWLWTGAKDLRGYGVLQPGGRSGKSVNAHRIALTLVGRDPGAIVDHKCHNTSCVRPDHLRTTTNKQNLENRKGANQNSKSGVRGVYWDKVNNKWHASVTHHGKHHGKRFSTIEAAAEWARTKRLELFTHSDADRS
jgi:hypothetical protein